MTNADNKLMNELKDIEEGDVAFDHGDQRCVDVSVWGEVDFRDDDCQKCQTEFEQVTDASKETYLFHIFSKSYLFFFVSSLHTVGLRHEGGGDLRGGPLGAVRAGPLDRVLALQTGDGLHRNRYITCST